MDVIWKIMDVVGPDIIRWLQTMYSVAEMSIFNESEVTSSICDIQSIR
jgi:hypothetical protein